MAGKARKSGELEALWKLAVKAYKGPEDATEFMDNIHGPHSLVAEALGCAGQAVCPHTLAKSGPDGLKAVRSYLQSRLKLNP